MRVALQEVLNVFAEFDSDGNGALDASEMQELFAALGVFLPEEQVAGMMSVSGCICRVQ